MKRIVAGGDAAPVLDPDADILDLVALAVELFAVIVLDLEVTQRRDAGSDATSCQRAASRCHILCRRAAPWRLAG